MWGRLRAGRHIEVLRRAGRSFERSLRRPTPLLFALPRQTSLWAASGSCRLVASRAIGALNSNSRWGAKPFWGRGFAPEAVRAMQRYAFDTLGCKALWCGYYEGNDKSLRVQQKCGFAPHHVERDVLCELMGDVRTECFTYLTREDWREQAQCE